MRLSTFSALRRDLEHESSLKSNGNEALNDDFLIFLSLLRKLWKYYNFEKISYATHCFIAS